MTPDPKQISPSKRPDRRDPLETAAALEWHRRATALGCRVCPETGEACEGVIRGHHVLRKQFVRAYVDAVAHERGLDAREKARMERDLVWDHRNALGVCNRRHERHHQSSGNAKIPLSLVPLGAIRFAAELGLAHRLERDYAAEA